MNAMLVIVPALALAAGGPETFTNREVPDDPYLPPPAEVAEPTPSLPIPAGASFGVQVNVSAPGVNIPGDAGNEPSIAVDPTTPNRMVIGWRQFDSVASNFRQAGVGYSNDGGRTWHFDGVIEPGIFRSDPVLDFDADGNFYYMSLTIDGGDFICELFASLDGGVTWDGGTPAFGGDKEWFGIDRTGGMGHGNVYHVWSPFFTPFAGSFARSTDGGQSFGDLTAMSVDQFWGTVSVGPDGTLYIAGVDQSFTPQLVRSSEAEDPLFPPTFDLAALVDLGGVTVLGAGPNPGGLLGQVWVATDHSGGASHGNVYFLASLNPPGSDPLDVLFARSTDGGVNWSAPVRVNDDASGTNAYQWFGTMSVAPNGRIDAIWNDTRNSGLSNISELFYSFSTDAGVTWSANEVVSPSFDSHIGWPNQNKIGDYYDMISDDVGAHLAWAATFNGEQDVYYLRIGDYDCNGNGIGDAMDLAAGTSDDCNDNEIPDLCEIAAGAVDDENGNGIPDGCEESEIPTVSQWGLIVMTGFLLVSGTVVFGRRGRVSGSSV